MCHVFVVRYRAILTAVVIALSLTAAADDPVRALDATLPRPAIVLLWADWCAPCRAEVAQLPALTAAAAPMRVIVVAVDATPRSAALLARVPDGQKRLFTGSSHRLLYTWRIAAPGLPVAIVRDAGGHVCGWKSGGIDPVTLTRMAQCARLPVASTPVRG